MVRQRLVGLAMAALAVSLMLPNCSSQGVPYTDRSAQGYIGFCDKSGKQITHGKLSDSPFVPLAVSSTPAKPPYDGYAKTATMYAYTPLQGYQSPEWPGDQITAGAYFTNPAHPMVAATKDEGAQLQQFVSRYPPKWNGYVQLRIYLSIPNQPTYNLTYPATDIQVKGNTWTVVRGGEIDCGAGSAVSVQVTNAPPPSSPTP